jgi:IS1 family transposase
MGLKVEYLAPGTELWQAYWRLYCDQRLAIRQENTKLFESDYASCRSARLRRGLVCGRFLVAPYTALAVPD